MIQNDPRAIEWLEEYYRPRANNCWKGAISLIADSENAHPSQHLMVLPEADAKEMILTGWWELLYE